MNEKEFEGAVERLLKQDLQEGDAAFRDKLLGRCLDVLCEDDEGTHLKDEDLDLLSAAGDPALVLQDNNTPGAYRINAEIIK
jgi:hypothetical protein